jgi:hypothetical protein
MNVAYTLKNGLYATMALCTPYKNYGVQPQPPILKGYSQYCTLYSIIYIFILLIINKIDIGIYDLNTYSADECCSCDVAYNFHGMLLGILGER